MTSRAVQLRENETTCAVPLTALERAALNDLVPSIRIAPSATEGFDLTPAAVIGAIRLGERPVVIQPKFNMAHVLFLLTYAYDPRTWRHPTVDLADTRDVTAAIIPAFSLSRLEPSAEASCRVTGLWTKQP